MRRSVVTVVSAVAVALFLQSAVVGDQVIMVQVIIRLHPAVGIFAGVKTTIGKDVKGYIGPTPLKIYIQKNKVQKIEALKNQETPKYFAKVKRQLLDKWNGKTVNEAMKMKVDGVTGATYSSEAVIKNVRLGLGYYKKNK